MNFTEIFQYDTMANSARSPSYNSGDPNELEWVEVHPSNCLYFNGSVRAPTFLLWVKFSMPHLGWRALGAADLSSNLQDHLQFLVDATDVEVFPWPKSHVLQSKLTQLGKKRYHSASEWTFTDK